MIGMLLRVVVPAAIVAAVLATMTTGAHDGTPATLASDTAQNRMTGPNACRLLGRSLAGDFVASVGRHKRSRFATNHESCTWFSRDQSLSVTAAVYPAENYEQAVDVLPTRRARLLGRDAAFNERLGYLIKLPGRPYYLQATFFHVRHLHADRQRSEELAAGILGLRQTPGAARAYVCSIDGKRA